MMIGDFVAINDLLCMDRNGIFQAEGFCRIRDQPRQGCGHILGQKAAVRAGISEHFLFVKALCIVQCLLCRKSQQTVGIPLERG